ncbi:MAG: copper chaperone PCu(A)C [Alphaproteobacteria bacterium]|nr:copper chaperone PCu(A)C [Alphaproteobacteria bacterium]
MQSIKLNGVAAAVAGLLATVVVALDTAAACEKHDKAAHAQTKMTRVADAGTTHNHAQSHAGLSVEKAWTRATPPGAKVAGGFVTITNSGKEPDKLVGASFALSKSVEVHEMTMTDGVMRMNEVEGGLAIAPGTSVELKPGSYHLMFMDLTGTPKESEPVKGTLRFEKAGEIAIEFAVAPIGAKSIDGAGGNTPAGHGHGGHEMKHQH